MTAWRFFSIIIMAAALLSAFAAFAFVAAPSAAMPAAVAAADLCPDFGPDSVGLDPVGLDSDCPDHGAAMERGCCGGASCVGVWLTPEGPAAAAAAAVSAVLVIPAGRLIDGVGAPPDPRPPRRFV